MTNLYVCLCFNFYEQEQRCVCVFALFALIRKLNSALFGFKSNCCSSLKSYLDMPPKFKNVGESEILWIFSVKEVK